LEKVNGLVRYTNNTYSFKVSATGKAYKSLDEKAVDRSELLEINVNSEVVILKKKYENMLGVCMSADKEK
jgi:hypothetical protein